MGDWVLDVILLFWVGSILFCIGFGVFELLMEGKLSSPGLLIGITIYAGLNTAIIAAVYIEYYYGTPPVKIYTITF